jgi:Flp pilus assembly protein TadG
MTRPVPAAARAAAAARVAIRLAAPFASRVAALAASRPGPRPASRPASRPPARAAARFAPLLAPLRAAFAPALADRRGAMAVLAAFGLVVVMGGAVLALDMARVQTMTSRIQLALDAATLAAAAEPTDDPARLTALANAMLAVNLRPETLAGATVSSLSVTTPRGPDGSREVRIEIGANVPLSLASMAGLLGETSMTHANVTAASQATRRTRGAEVMMVLDLTGSMHGDPVADLRRAARDLVDALFGDRASVPNLYVGLTPYTASVNVGRQHALWIGATGPTELDYGATQWKGCVMARSTTLFEGDDPPSNATRLFQRFYYESTRSCMNQTTPTNGSNCVFSPSSLVDSRTPNRWRDRLRTRYWINEAPLDPARTFESQYWEFSGPNAGCPNAVVPLTAVRADVETAIDNLRAWARGGTLINLGLSWGWRGLSPRWRGYWRRPDGSAIAALPMDYRTGQSEKILILMTDGDNMLGLDHTSLGRSGEMFQPSQLDASMLRLCDRVKAEGIALYVVALGAISEATQNNLRACASNPATTPRLPGEKYFYVPTGGTLRQAFGRIAGQISDLRLVD